MEHESEVKRVDALRFRFGEALWDYDPPSPHYSRVELIEVLVGIAMNYGKLKGEREGQYGVILDTDPPIALGAKPKRIVDTVCPKCGKGFVLEHKVTIDVTDDGGIECMCPHCDYVEEL